MMEQERTDVYDLVAAPETNEADSTYIHTGRNRKIRVYRQIDVRMTLADLFAKLIINFG